MASSANRASWLVATSVVAVEALKDQGGLCGLRSLHQCAKKNTGSLSHAKRNISASSAAVASYVGRLRMERAEEQAKQSEESLRKVTYLSCWGPN